MADLNIIFQPILVRYGKIGTYQLYRDYGMQFFTILNPNGGALMTGMTPSGPRLYPDNNINSTGGTLDQEYNGHEMPLVRDNPDVGLDATGNYPGNY